MYRRRACGRALFLERCYIASCNQRQQYDYSYDTAIRKRQRSNKQGTGKEQLSIEVGAICLLNELHNSSSTMVTLQDTEFLPSDDDDADDFIIPKDQPMVICPLCSDAALDDRDTRVFCSSCGMSVDVGASIRPLSYLLDRMNSVMGEHK
ncbi:hypothetical protein BDF22DRAFT_741106 [Syncephalis plumigaleata]|nr:hypothetical protein BDF22DRAFT_741106 [Syncephalis plumigaleata]